MWQSQVENILSLFDHFFWLCNVVPVSVSVPESSNLIFSNSYLSTKSVPNLDLYTIFYLWPPHNLCVWLSVHFNIFCHISPSNTLSNSIIMVMVMHNSVYRVNSACSYSPSSKVDLFCCDMYVNMLAFILWIYINFMYVQHHYNKHINPTRCFFASNYKPEQLLCIQPGIDAQLHTVVWSSLLTAQLEITFMFIVLCI